MSEWITKKDKTNWITKKDKTNWITKKDKSAEIGGQEGFKDEKKKYVPLDKRVYSTPMEARKAADDEDRANLREIRSVEDKSKKSTKTTKSKAKNPKFYGYTNITKY
jgi:hypothetical protein